MQAITFAVLLVITLCHARGGSKHGSGRSGHHGKPSPNRKSILAPVSPCPDTRCMLTALDAVCGEVPLDDIIGNATARCHTKRDEV